MRAERLASPDAAVAAAAASAAAVGDEAVHVAAVARRRRRLGRHSAVACRVDRFTIL